MYIHYILWALSAYSVLLASLPQHSERNGSLTTESKSSSNLPPPSILSLPGRNSTVDSRLKIVCDKIKFGKNLKVTSCRNVFNYLGRGESQLIFAERLSGVPLDVPLPLRTFSSEENQAYKRC